MSLLFYWLIPLERHHIYLYLLSRLAILYTFDQMFYSNTTHPFPSESMTFMSHENLRHFVSVSLKIRCSICSDINTCSMRLHWVPLTTNSATTSRLLCTKIIDCNAKKFRHNEHPLITSSFFCIFLLVVSVTQCIPHLAHDVSLRQFWNNSSIQKIFWPGNLMSDCRARSYQKYFCKSSSHEIIIRSPLYFHEVNFFDLPQSYVHDTYYHEHNKIAPQFFTVYWLKTL